MNNVIHLKTLVINRLNSTKLRIYGCVRHVLSLSTMDIYILINMLAGV